MPLTFFTGQCLGGGIGRHARLKIWWALPVSVRLRPEVPSMQSSADGSRNLVAFFVMQSSADGSRNLVAFFVMQSSADGSRNLVAFLTLWICGRSSAVEHHLAKVRVDGSIPFARSIFFPIHPRLLSSNQYTHHVRNSQQLLL